MPFTKQYAARQFSPDKFVRFRYAKGKGGKGVDFIYGFKKGGGSEIQSIRFDKKIFTSARAKKWLKVHGFSTGLEASTGGLVMPDGAPISEIKHEPSFEELRELVDEALREKFPINDPDHPWRQRFFIKNLWANRVLLQRDFYSNEENNPKYALANFSLNHDPDEGEFTVVLGELTPVSIQAVPKDGGDGVILDEAGRRNSGADASKINTAIRALIAALNDDDLEEETIDALNTKMLAPINGEGDFQDFGEAKYTDKPWDGAKSRFTDEQLLRSIPGAIAAWVRSQVSADKGTVRGLAALPYKEPDGTVNLGGVRNALARLSQVEGIPSGVLSRARAELQRALAAGNKALGKSEGQVRNQQDIVTEAWNSLPGETFQEAFEQALSEVEIDHDNLILKNVVILGPISTNKRKYSVETQQKALPLLEGIRAYVNHPRMNEMSEPRDMRDLVGEHKNVRVVGDRTVSDLHLLDNAAVRDVVLPVAESKPHLIGNSIVARGKMVREKDGTDNVEEILAVRSVDIVTEPATTKSLFAEGKQLFSVEEEMELESLTLETLKKKRPDLFEAVSAALTTELEAKNAREAEAKALKDKVSALEARVAEQEQGLLERDQKIATGELEKAKAQKDASIEGLFKTAKIPDRVKYVEKGGIRSVNPHFRSLMERCQGETEMKELVRAWEETYRQGPISEEKRFNFGDDGNVGNEATSQLFRALA